MISFINILVCPKLERSYHQGQAVVPPPVALVEAPTPYVDPTLLTKLMRATIKGITSVSAPIVTTPTNNVIALVWIVKSMREMGCKPFLKEQDIEIVGR